MPAKITDRDLRVVDTVYRYKYMTGTQIQRLHFPSETTRNRRLRRLTDEGLLEAFQILNIPERLFKLSRDGGTLVAGRLGIALEDLLWNPSTKKPKDYYFMRHLLGINDFRITLELACTEGTPDLRGFIPEYYGTKKQSGKVIKYVRDVTFGITDPHEHIPHTPDAVFCLEKEGRPALFFLEIDRGTEVLSNPQKGVLKMIRFYLGYLAGGGYTGYSEDFKTEEPFSTFRALIVTSSKKRAQNMREAATSLPQQMQRGLKAIWCAATDEITPTSVFTPVWRSLDPGDDNRYTIG